MKAKKAQEVHVSLRKAIISDNRTSRVHSLHIARIDGSAPEKPSMNCIYTFAKKNKLIERTIERQRMVLAS